MNTKEKDSQYIMHTYGRYNVALKSGKGATAYDEDGKKYVDVASGIGVNSLGWCEDGWVKAVSEQANTIQHMSNYFIVRRQAILPKSSAHLQAFQRYASEIAVRRLMNVPLKLRENTALISTVLTAMRLLHSTILSTAEQ